MRAKKSVSEVKLRSRFRAGVRKTYLVSGDAISIAMLESHSVILLIQVTITAARVVVAGCFLIFTMALITGASVLSQVVTARFHTIGEAGIQGCLSKIERAT